VLAFAHEYARGRRIFLTTTHFHPEHAFGAQAFRGGGDLPGQPGPGPGPGPEGPGYVEMFTGLGDAVAAQLCGVELSEPDVVYDDTYELDLGGRVVTMRATGRGHTHGDQVVRVPDDGLMFTGDLAETGQFAIFPWFPPVDVDVSWDGSP